MLMTRAWMNRLIQVLFDELKMLVEVSTILLPVEILKILTW
jgi:hypothetical protein